MTEHRKK